MVAPASYSTPTMPTRWPANYMDFNRYYHSYAGYLSPMYRPYYPAACSTVTGAAWGTPVTGPTATEAKADGSESDSSSYYSYSESENDDATSVASVSPRPVDERRGGRAVHPNPDIVVCETQKKDSNPRREVSPVPARSRSRRRYTARARVKMIPTARSQQPRRRVSRETHYGRAREPARAAAQVSVQKRMPRNDDQLARKSRKSVNFLARPLAPVELKRRLEDDEMFKNPMDEDDSEAENDDDEATLARLQVSVVEQSFTSIGKCKALSSLWELSL